MLKALAKLDEQMSRKLPPRTVGLLPGTFFFCRNLELPKNLSAQELTHFAEFSLEGMSPFALEHLAWGYMVEEGVAPRRLFVYAAYRDRVRKTGFTQLEAHQRVFPDFILALHRVVSGATVSFYAYGNSLSAVFLPAGSRIPEKVASVPLSGEGEDMGEDACRAAREHLLADLDTNGYEVSSEVTIIDSAEIDADNRVFLRATSMPADPATPSPLDPIRIPLQASEMQMWNADVREPDFKRARRKQQTFSSRIWLGTVAAGVAAALFILLHIGFRVTHGWMGARQATIAAQEGEANEVYSKIDFRQKIQQIAQSELKPFEMLEVMNVGRPKEVHFMRANTSGFNQITVEGEGSTADVVNRYTDFLKSSPYILEVEDKVRIVRNRAPFSLKITFREDLERDSEVVAGTERNERMRP